MIYTPEMFAALDLNESPMMVRVSLLNAAEEILGRVESPIRPKQESMIFQFPTGITGTATAALVSIYRPDHPGLQLFGEKFTFLPVNVFTGDRFDLTLAFDSELWGAVERLLPVKSLWDHLRTDDPC